MVEINQLTSEQLKKQRIHDILCDLTRIVVKLGMEDLCIDYALGLELDYGHHRINEEVVIQGIQMVVLSINQKLDNQRIREL